MKTDQELSNLKTKRKKIFLSRQLQRLVIELGNNRYIHEIVVPEGEKTERGRKTFEKIVTKKFLNLVKDIHLWIQESQ